MEMGEIQHGYINELAPVRAPGLSPAGPSVHAHKMHIRIIPLRNREVKVFTQQLPSPIG